MPKPKQHSASTPQYNTATFDSFGAPRIDKVNATIVDDYYIIGDNKDKNKKQLYHVLRLKDDETGEEYTPRNWAGYLCDESGEKLSWAPSPDNMTLAGPDGVDEQTYIDLGAGNRTLAELSEEAGEDLTDESFSGPYAVGRASALPGPGLRMIREYLNKVMKAENLSIPGNDFKSYHGYSFFWSQEAQDNSGRKKSGDNQDTREYTVLVPITFNSAPKSASKGASAGAGTGASGAKSGAKKSDANPAGGSKAGNKSAGDDDAEIDAEIEEQTVTILTETGEPIMKIGPNGWQAQLIEQFKEKYADDTKQRQKMVQGVIARGNDKGAKAGWFLSEDRPWTVSDSGEISI